MLSKFQFLWVCAVLVIVCVGGWLVFSGKNSHDGTAAPRLGVMLVEEFRSNIEIYDGYIVNVMGVLHPIKREDDVDNVVLSPSALFEVNLPDSYIVPVSVGLGIEIFADDGSVQVDHECFGKLAVVTGMANLYSGVPAIEEIRLMVSVGDREVRCLP